MRLVRAAVAGALLALASAGSSFAQGLRDEEIEHMLREFTDPLLEAGGLNPPDVKIFLLGDPTMNAGVGGGQNIFVNAGIITAAELPIELKGVMAHETGHITGAHNARSGEMARAAMGPMFATMAAGIAAAMAGQGDAAVGLLASSQYFGTLSAFTYSRGQESRADLAAVDFLEATGQSAEGLIAFFDRFREQELFSEQRRYPYFRTHPVSSDRVSVLRERLEHQQYKDAVDPPEHVVMLRRAQAKLHGFLDPPTTTFRRFSEDDDSIEAIYARSIAHYRAGSLAEAMTGIDELISREPENPYFWELKGQVYYEHGQAPQAIEPYARAVELMPQSALFKIGLAQSLLDGGDEAQLQESLDLLIAALAIEPDNGFGWYQRSRVHEARGETAMAMLCTAERHYYGGDPRRAYQFAARAREDLTQGTREWLRASDILASVAAVMETQGPGER
jgi:predicted Zn-dependent protease